MAKLTKEAFQKMNETPEVKEKNLTTARNAICRNVLRWQGEDFAWDAEALNSELPEYSITPSFVIERCYTPKGEQHPVIVAVSFDRTPDTPDNEGVFGKYKLIQVQDGYWRIEK